MKKIICYIDTLGRGGAQRVMSNLVRYFHEKGYEVILVNDFIRDEALPHYEVPAEVKREYLRRARAGLPVVKQIQRACRLVKVIRKHNPDIVLSFLGRPNIIALLAGRLVKTPIVVSVRNDPNREYGAGAAKKWFANLLFRRANGVVFQTEDAAKYFSEKIRSRSRIILNPVDRAMYSDADIYERRDIITLGRMEPQKNHKMLIDAFHKIADQYPGENLYIYGVGRLMGQTETYVAQKGLQDRVLLPGNIANVKQALCNAKLFVLSSDYEGLPNALMEAMATATPAISTDCPCGGPRTLIQSEMQGLLVPVGDTDTLARAMDELLADDGRRELMGAEARKRADAFCDSVVYEQWETYFLEILRK